MKSSERILIFVGSTVNTQLGIVKTLVMEINANIGWPWEIGDETIQSATRLRSKIEAAGILATLATVEASISAHHVVASPLLCVAIELQQADQGLKNQANELLAMVVPTDTTMTS